MNLSFDTSDNLAGLAGAYYVPVEHIADDRSPRVLLHSGRCWFSCGSVKYSEGHSNELKRSSKGGLLTARLDGRVAKMTWEMNESLNKMKDRHFVVIYRDLNGQYMKVGSTAYPLKFTFNAETGRQPGEFNGLKFKFSGTVPFLPRLYEYALKTSEGTEVNTQWRRVVTVTFNGNAVARLLPGQQLEIVSDFTIEFKIL